jgi:hypothetical protein
MLVPRHRLRVGQPVSLKGGIPVGDNQRPAVGELDDPGSFTVTAA